MPSRKDHKAKSGKGKVRRSGVAAKPRSGKAAPGTPSAGRASGSSRPPSKVSASLAKSKPELPARQGSRKPLKGKSEKAAENARKVVAKLARDAAGVLGRNAQSDGGAIGQPMLSSASASRPASRSAQGSAIMVAADKRAASAKKDSGKMNGGKASGKSGSASAPRARATGNVVASMTAGVRSGGDGGQGSGALQSGPKAAEAAARGIALPTGYRPSDSEPFMNERQRLYFRNKLIAWKEEIVRLNRETLNGLHEDSAQHADVADRATFETDRALELRARDRQRKLISKIDAALARLEEGSYGYCEETGEPIGLKRLDARPIATLSIEAQERHERRERVFREE